MSDPVLTSSYCTAWDSFNTPRLWSMVMNEDDSLARDQVSAWRTLAGSVRSQRQALVTAKAELTAAWPPEENASAAAFVAELDTLIARLDAAAVDADTTANGLNRILDALSTAKRQIEPLWEKYKDKSTDLVPRWFDSAEEELDQEARRHMIAMEGAVQDAVAMLRVPPQYQLGEGGTVIWPPEPPPGGGDIRSPRIGPGGISVPVPHDPVPPLPGLDPIAPDGGSGAGPTAPGAGIGGGSIAGPAAPGGGIGTLPDRGPDLAGVINPPAPPLLPGAEPLPGAGVVPPAGGGPGAGGVPLVPGVLPGGGPVPGGAVRPPGLGGAGGRPPAGGRLPLPSGAVIGEGRGVGPIGGPGATTGRGGAGGRGVPGVGGAAGRGVPGVGGIGAPGVSGAGGRGVGGRGVGGAIGRRPSGGAGAFDADEAGRGGAGRGGGPQLGGVGGPGAAGGMRGGAGGMRGGVGGARGRSGRDRRRDDDYDYEAGGAGVGGAGATAGAGGGPVAGMGGRAGGGRSGARAPRPAWLPDDPVGPDRHNVAPAGGRSRTGGSWDDDEQAGYDPDNPWQVAEGVAPVIRPRRGDDRHDPGPNVIGRRG